MRDMLSIILKFGYEFFLLIKERHLNIMETGLNGGTQQKGTKPLIICLWMKTLAGYKRQPVQAHYQLLMLTTS